MIKRLQMLRGVLREMTRGTSHEFRQIMTKFIALGQEIDETATALRKYGDYLLPVR